MSLIFCYGISITTLAAVYLGNLGEHLEATPEGLPLHPEQFEPFAKSLWVLQYMAILATGPTKINVLRFYKRIFISRGFRSPLGLVSHWQRYGPFYFSWRNCVSVAIERAGMVDRHGAVNCLAQGVNWRPILGESGKCISIAKLFWSTLISDIVSNALILALPWPHIFKLHMSLARKFQVGFVFLLGAFVVGAGIARCVLSSDGVTSQSTDLDYTYSRSPAVYWTIVEATVGVISACLPTLRPIIGQIDFTILASLVRQALFRSSKSGSDTASAMPNSKKHASDEEKVGHIYQSLPDGPFRRDVTAQSVPANGFGHKDGISVTQEFTRVEHSSLV